MEKSPFTEHYRIFTAALRKMREEAGLTQRQLAKRLGRDHTMIYRIERGERRLDYLEFYRLCLALDQDPLQVMTAVVKEWRGLDRLHRRTASKDR